MGKSAEDIDEEGWFEERRTIVEEYLRLLGVDHLGVGEIPAFFVHPCVSVWAVQSKKVPGRIGWWAICGDLPTDYISGSVGNHPREALRAFSRQWREVSAAMLRGESYPNSSIGTKDQWPHLGVLLLRRAELLQEFADDDGLWPE